MMDENEQHAGGDEQDERREHDIEGREEELGRQISAAAAAETTRRPNRGTNKTYSYEVRYGMVWFMRDVTGMVPSRDDESILVF